MKIRYYRVVSTHFDETFNTRFYVLSPDGLSEPGCRVAAVVYNNGDEPHRLREEDGTEYTVQLTMEATGYGPADIEVVIELGGNNAA